MNRKISKAEANVSTAREGDELPLSDASVGIIDRAYAWCDEMRKTMSSKIYSSMISESDRR